MNSLLNVVFPLRQQLVKHQRSLQSFLLYFYKNHFSIIIDFIHIEMLRVLRLSKPCNTHFLNSFLLLEMLFIARADQNLVIDRLLSFIVILCYYSRLPVTRTLYNSNLPLTRSNFHFPLDHFLYNFTLNNSNFSLFPLKVRIIGSRLQLICCYNLRIILYTRALVFKTVT